MTSTTAVCSKVSVIMKPLAPSTPVNVARTGINTRVTMLTANAHDRASRMITAPVSTTGTEHANAQPTTSQKSAVGIRPPRRCPVGGPHIAAPPHRLHPMPLAQLGAQPFDVNSHRRQVSEIPVPHLPEEILPGEDGISVGEEEQQQVELAVGEVDRRA